MDTAMRLVGAARPEGDRVRSSTDDTLARVPPRAEVVRKQQDARHGALTRVQPHAYRLGQHAVERALRCGPTVPVLTSERKKLHKDLHLR